MDGLDTKQLLLLAPGNFGADLVGAITAVITPWSIEADGLSPLWTLRPIVDRTGLASLDALPGPGVNHRSAQGDEPPVERARVKRQLQHAVV
jgi:hypothetical protein